MVKVKLHGYLGQEIGEEWNLNVSSVAEAFRAIEANTKKLTKLLINQSEKNAKYEILINHRPLWVPKAEELPTDYNKVNKKHFEMLSESEMFMNFKDELKTIDIIPIVEGAGGGGGGGAQGCFPAGTKISTPQGIKNIEDLKEGDEIFSFNKDKNIEIDMIEKVFEHENNKILKITLWDGSIIRSTANHWFFNEYNRFTPLENFQVGDVLIHESGDVMPIEKIEEDGSEKVYNFHVLKNHTYIANNIFVHNGGGGKSGGGGKGGAAGGGMKSIFAVFLAIILAPVSGGGSLSLLGMLAPAILGLVALGVSMLLMKPPPMVSPQAIANPSADFEASPDSGGGEPSYTFNGPVNTIGEGGPVPIGYGRLIIGSQQIFSSYDQLYRIQSRANKYESDGKAPNGVGAGEKNYPTKSFYFNHMGYPVNIQDVQGYSIQENSLAL
jgi:predicted phage tail protein